MLRKTIPQYVLRYYSYLLNCAYLLVFILTPVLHPATVYAVCAEYAYLLPANATDVEGFFNQCPHCPGVTLCYGDNEEYIETLDTITCTAANGSKFTRKLTGSIHDVKVNSFRPLPAGAILTGSYTYRQRIYTNIASFDGCDDLPIVTYNDLYATVHQICYTFQSQIAQCCSDANGDGADDGTGLNCTPIPSPAPANNEGASCPTGGN